MSTTDKTKLNALIPNLESGKFADPELLQAIIEEVYAYLDARADTSEVLTKTNTTPFTPSDSYQPATKKYTDDQINAAIIAIVGTPIFQTGTVFPSTPVEGQAFYRSDEKRFYTYSGSMWNGSANATDVVGSTMYTYQNFGGF